MIIIDDIAAGEMIEEFRPSWAGQGYLVAWEARFAFADGLLRDARPPWTAVEVRGHGRMREEDGRLMFDYAIVCLVDNSQLRW